MKKSTCKAELKKNAISEHVFKRELEMCKKLSRENGGKCNWGKCEDCGVIPLLYKLNKGILLEDLREVENTKNQVFNS